MKYLRSILSLLLVCITTLLVSCGNPTVATPPTYTPNLVAEIGRYSAPIAEMQEELPRLGKLIQKRDWNNVQSFIHGPLGELRHDMSSIARTVLTRDEESVRELAKEISGHLNHIDAAAKESQYSTALENYKEVVIDIETFLSLVSEVTQST